MTEDAIDMAWQNYLDALDVNADVDDYGAFKAGWMAREAFEHGKTSQQHRSDAVARLLAAREIQIKDYPDSESEWHETREGGLPE